MCWHFTLGYYTYIYIYKYKYIYNMLCRLLCLLLFSGQLDSVLSSARAPARALARAYYSNEYLEFRQLDRAGIGGINEQAFEFQSLFFRELSRQAEAVGKRPAAPLQIADARRLHPLGLERPR